MNSLRISKPQRPQDRAPFFYACSIGSSFRLERPSHPSLSSSCLPSSTQPTQTAIPPKCFFCLLSASPESGRLKPIPTLFAHPVQTNSSSPLRISSYHDPSSLACRICRRRYRHYHRYVRRHSKGTKIRQQRVLVTNVLVKRGKVKAEERELEEQMGQMGV